MTIIVTGAAGFIGSNIVKALNERGEQRVIAVDNLTRADKFKNLVDCEIDDYLDKTEFVARFKRGDFGKVKAIFHEGACSDTMETDGRYMMENNFRYSRDVLDTCLEQGVQFLYASSAAVYGGSSEFVESREVEKPLNVYGYSKFLFDQVIRQILPTARSQIAGFRTERSNPPIEHFDADSTASFHCILCDFARGGRVRLLEGRMTHGWIQEFMKLPKAATGKNLLAGDSRHALLEELQQADLALRARGEIRRPSLRG